MLPASESSHKMVLSGALNFDTVVEMRDLIKPHLESGHHLIVDFRDVTNANSAGLALALQWVEDASKHDCHVVYHNLPAALLDIAELHGVKRLLPTN